MSRYSRERFLMEFCTLLIRRLRAINIYISQTIELCLPHPKRISLFYKKNNVREDFLRERTINFCDPSINVNANLITFPFRFPLQRARARVRGVKDVHP